MKTRTHFAHRIDMLDAAGEIQEHLAGIEAADAARPRRRGDRVKRRELDLGSEEV
jgi:hypothetical protein